MADKKNGAVVFDFTRIGMFDLEDFQVAQSSNEFRKMATIMARCCVKCPAEWGNANEPEAFNRPAVGEWRWKELTEHFWASLAAEGESKASS
jgi:hypothetical protein